jgi:ABC-type ATPase involved in cell division
MTVKKDIEKCVNEKIEEIGLEKKRNQISKRLSGG